MNENKTIYMENLKVAQTCQNKHPSHSMSKWPYLHRLTEKRQLTSQFNRTKNLLFKESKKPLICEFIAILSILR